MQRPLLLLAAALAAGALCGADLTLVQAAHLLAAAAVLMALALRAPARAAPPALAAAACLLGAAAAAVETGAYEAMPLRRFVLDPSSPPDPVQLEGVAVRDARPRGERSQVLLDVQSVRVGPEQRLLRGRARIEVAGEAAPGLAVSEGEKVVVWAQISSPRARRVPGAFDSAAHAFREGVHATGYCKSTLLLERLGRQGGAGRHLPARLRQWARDTLGHTVLPGPEQALVTAMVLGDRAALDEETAEAFRAAGTYHVLAISGAQVALLAGLLAALLKRLPVPPLARALVCGAALVFYAELVGGEVPVTRAAVMACVLLVGRALSLTADLANLLGLAGALLIVARPSAIGDLSFQLSFAATLGILLLTPPLLRHLRPLPLRLDLALAGSLAAQLALTPLLASQFHRLAPAALLLNLAAVPLSAAVLLAGMAVLLCAASMPVLAPLAGDVAWVCAHALLRSADVVRWLPALDLRVPSPAVWAVALHAAGLVLLATRGLRRAALPLALGVLGLGVGRAAPADGRLSLAVLDVGQGDALVLRGPSGGVWVVDAGPAEGARWDSGEAVVGPYLWSTGVRKLDRLLITHAHPDHAGGAPFLLRSFPVAETWEGPAPRHDAGWDRLDRALRAAPVNRRTVVAGTRVDWQGATVDVLWPPRSPRAPWSVRNDDSVVLKVQYGATILLLAGDLERAGEARMTTPAAGVLKVPHHGSRSSSTPAFVAAVSPRLAVVSAGFRNRYGHPHPDVVARYLRRGVELLRTDEHGAVTVSSDGQRLWVRTAREGGERRVR